MDDQVRDQYRIRRLEANYFLAVDHPSVESPAGQLDDVMRGLLPDVLEDLLRGARGEADREIWFIRRLETRLVISTAWPPDEMARTWGSEIARQILATVNSPDPSQDVVWFPDRTAYLRQFILDLADGNVWSRWYHRDMEGLRSLPESGAIRSVACDYGPEGLAALMLMKARDFRTVLRALSSEDARRIVEASRLEEGVASPDPDLARLMLNSWSGSGHLLATSHRHVIALYLLHCARSGHASLAAAVPLAIALATVLDASRAVSERIGSGPAIAGRRPSALIVGALRDGDVAQLTEWCGPDALQELRHLIRAPSSVLDEVAGALDDGLQPESGTSDERRFTSFGGAFLVLGVLDSLPLAEAAAGWPEPEGASAANALRFAVLLRCLGVPFGAFGDSVLRDLMGIGPTFTPSVARAWAATLSPLHLSPLIDLLGRWRSESGQLGSTVILCRPSAAAGTDDPLWVLVDRDSGFWLDVRCADPGAMVHVARPPPTEVLVAGEPFDISMPDGADVAFFDADLEDATELHAVLSRRTRVREELDYLCTPVGDDHVDAVLTITAQAVVRAFAHRLIGFSSSSMTFLSSNFLDVPASVAVEEETSRWVVRLARPPLDVVLKMTGMGRQAHAPSWLGGVRIELFGDDA